MHLYILKSKCVLIPTVASLEFMRVIPGKRLCKPLLRSSMQTSFVSFCLVWSHFMAETLHSLFFFFLIIMEQC